MTSPRVAILMGSKSDWPVMEAAAEALKRFGVPYLAKVMSAHRTPDDVAAFAREARQRGFSVIIAGAGKAAHLAGVIAAHTTLAVIGVPMPAKELDGLDALLATVQMPPGVPVATVAIGGAKNAAILAVQMLAIADPGLAEKLAAYKEELAAEARAQVLEG
jgi:5-(carboxyamino)imidazole ribonucleotide mutase